MDDRAQVRALMREADRMQADLKQLETRERRAQKTAALYAEINELTAPAEALPGRSSHGWPCRFLRCSGHLFALAKPATCCRVSGLVRENKCLLSGSGRAPRTWDNLPEQA